MTRDLDVVVHGATGFLGRLVAEDLAATAPAGVAVGLSGRSRRRLEQLRAALGPAAAGWPLLVTDAADRDDVAALAARTRVVATTVGPFLRHGLPLVQACAQAGTHYADVTGELLFARAAADGAHAPARRSGARVVLSCGFDSVPSDLGVLLAARQAQADGAGRLAEATAVVVQVRGGVSGGTVDSVRTVVDEVRRDPAARRLLADPHALSPDRDAEVAAPGEGDVVLPGYDRELGRWVAPYLLGPYNARVVRRSNALQGFTYGRPLRYREVLGVGRGPLAPALAAGVAVGSAALVAGLALPPARLVLDRLLPAPGQGPGERTRRTGSFRVEVHARTTSGARYVSTVAGRGDPGYAATAVLLTESALALACDGDRLPAAAGVLTPATGVGEVLADRLRARGLEVAVRRQP